MLEQRLETLENEVKLLTQCVSELTAALRLLSNVLIIPEAASNPRGRKDSSPRGRKELLAEFSETENPQIKTETVEVTPTPTPITSELTKSDVQKVLIDLMNKSDKQYVKSLLADFGATKISDLDPGQYTNIVAKAHQAMHRPEKADM